jgi:uncharacterized protein involved in exopolysaccharide biosynthesis
VDGDFDDPLQHSRRGRGGEFVLIPEPWPTDMGNDIQTERPADGRLAPGERVVYVLPLDSVAPDPARERSLLAMLQVLWDGRWWIAAVAALTLATAAAYVLLAPKVYRAEVLMIPAASLGRDGLAGQLGGLGGLASLAGIDIGGARSAEPVAMLQSSGFARAFVDEQKLLTVLYADKWDAQRGQWRDADPDRAPDLHDAVRLFERSVRGVEEDKKTGLVTLSIEWKDPQQAADWANLMVDRLNARMRARAIEEATANLRYLQEQLGELRVVDLNQPVGRLIETEMQQLVMAKGRPDFAFRVIDKAVAPKWPERPKRLRTFALALLLGPMLGALVVLVRSGFGFVTDTRRGRQ